MSTTLKEWLKHTIAELEEERDATPGVVNEDAAMALEAMKRALASLEAEAVALRDERSGSGGISKKPSFNDLPHGTPLYTAPPAPVSVKIPPEKPHTDGLLADGWNACRAAMLQGADGTLTNEGTIPVTQFKPVADLYGLTSPTGCETSFTFDAVEARDFIDGGWSCQEYVELERFQEAITNHTEDKLAMVDHSGDSNNMVEPVTTAYKLPANVIDALEKALQAMSFMGDTLNDMDAVCEEDIEYVTPAFDAVRKVLEGNYPVIPDGWVLVPIEPTYQMCEAMGLPWESPRFPDRYKAMIAAAPHFREISNSSTKHFRENAETSTKCWCRTCRPVTNSDMRFVVCPDCGNKRCPHANDHRNACTGSNEPGQEGSAYPATPQQEISHALAKGMERYGDAMQELAKKEEK